jgi:hypothetical protein
MIAFFSTAERIAQLHLAAQRWDGTPFIAHACACGRGVDCVHLAAALYIESGALARFDPPAYTLDAGSHNNTSQVLDYLVHDAHFAEVSATGLMAGDALALNVRLSSHHVGVMLDGERFIHVLFNRGTMVSSLKEQLYSRRIVAVYRPVEGPATHV